MTICLTADELNSVRKCWNSVQVNNKYHKDQFITRLFSNLLAANGDLKQTFQNDSMVREHSLLFNDLLNYLIIYLDNIHRLDQFLDSFFKENSAIIHEINYLEPMGAALIQTFRQWLGKGIFNTTQESLWVQIYIYLANTILIFTDDDNSSIDDEQSIEETQGLNINKPQSIATPMTPVSPTPVLQLVEEEDEEQPIDVNNSDYENENAVDLTKSPSIQVNIRGNDKYKGFRRNDTNIVEVNPTITPRSPMRNLRSQSMTHLPSQESKPVSLPASPSRVSVSKFNNLKPRVIYDSDDEEDNKETFGFDPRKSKKSVSRIADIKPPLPPKDVFFNSRTSINDETDDELNIDEQPTELDFSLHQAVENSDNDVADNSSSIYNSDHTDNSEPSSQSSNDNTLSLHSYHSAGTEATEATEPMSSKLNMRTLSSAESTSNSTRLFSNASPSMHSRATSVSSMEPDYKMQKSIELRQRASLGFMRSSFILKKEIETLGYNRAENVFMKPPTIPAALSSTPNLNSYSAKNNSSISVVKEIVSQNGSMTNLSSSDEEDQCFDLVNSFAPVTELSKLKSRQYTLSCSDLNKGRQSHSTIIGLQKHSRSITNLSLAKNNSYEPMNCVDATASLRPSNKAIGTIIGKKSFKDKVKSFFGSSAKPVSPAPISSPLETTYSSNSNLIKTQSKLSTTPSFISVDRTRSESRDNFSDLHSFSNRRGNKMSSVSDLRSMQTVESGESTSGFSFFSRRNSIDTKYSRGNGKKKYNVTSTPYDVFAHNKTIF